MISILKIVNSYCWRSDFQESWLIAMAHRSIRINGAIPKSHLKLIPCRVIIIRHAPSKRIPARRIQRSVPTRISRDVSRIDWSKSIIRSCSNPKGEEREGLVDQNRLGSPLNQTRRSYFTSSFLSFNEKLNRVNYQSISLIACWPHIIRSSFGSACSATNGAIHQRHDR